MTYNVRHWSTKRQRQENAKFRVAERAANHSNIVHIKWKPEQTHIANIEIGTAGCQSRHAQLRLNVEN